ncbi:hypothetical protein DVG78_14690 [Runella aurantiaca]|uniref:Uncharacterized protein n=2 Tax=Runella aurantiaca TaxID=2282308 RepID=A0A369IES8_9BACT|nr:hypothetical protein DVG78_14690 [Runella aurantiaca]
MTMETIAKTEEQVRQERAVAWAKRLLASKRELEKEIEEEAKTPEYQEAVRKLREQNKKKWDATQKAIILFFVEGVTILTPLIQITK